MKSKLSWAFAGAATLLMATPSLAEINVNSPGNLEQPVSDSPRVHSSMMRMAFSGQARAPRIALALSSSGTT